ncbi:IS1595 family transposase [Campylobacter sp. MOP7]|uniref:IS1595 family transposase n=1 Tax=Campylobacter canis TaxID=3378588 RepID=UPI00387E2C5B
MAQHFLLSAEARKLSLIKIARMNDFQAIAAFKQVRWFETKGNPVCPCCDSSGKIYFIASRKQFKCKECASFFSVTSGTIFHGHKLSLQTILMAICIFVNAAKGISALQLSRDLGVQYKTAWVLLHKIRESLMDYDSSRPFQGVVEMDGVYVNGYIRPKNRLEKRIDRRKAYKPNKRVVISLRQRNEFGIGANRTRTFILRSENGVELSRIAHRFIVRGSEVHTDENIGYSNFIAHYDHRVVNHAVEYCGINGENNNQSESYNSRFRRLQYGQCHKLGTLYLSNYANEIAYREDTRRFNNGFIFRDILKKCLDRGISNEFCGYWQGNHIVAERLGI